MRTLTLPPDIELAMIDGVAEGRERAIANGHPMQVAEWCHGQRRTYPACECAHCHAFVQAEYTGGTPVLFSRHITEPCPGGKEGGDSR